MNLTMLYIAETAFWVSLMVTSWVLLHPIGAPVVALVWLGLTIWINR